MGSEVNLELRGLLSKGLFGECHCGLPQAARELRAVPRRERGRQNVCACCVRGVECWRKKINSLCSFVSGFRLLGTNSMLCVLSSRFFKP